MGFKKISKNRPIAIFDVNQVVLEKYKIFYESFENRNIPIHLILPSSLNQQLSVVFTSPNIVTFNIL